MTADQFKAAANRLPLFHPVFVDATYEEITGRIHAHRFADEVWQDMTQAELSAKFVTEKP